MAQVVEHLPSKCKTLKSNPTSAKLPKNHNKKSPKTKSTKYGPEMWLKY
jgi:hypothetical protein